MSAPGFSDDRFDTLFETLSKQQRDNDHLTLENNVLKGKYDNLASKLEKLHDLNLQWKHKVDDLLERVKSQKETKFTVYENCCRDRTSNVKMFATVKSMEKTLENLRQTERDQQEKHENQIKTCEKTFFDNVQTFNTVMKNEELPKKMRALLNSALVTKTISI